MLGTSDVVANLFVKVTVTGKEELAALRGEMAGVGEGASIGSLGVKALGVAVAAVGVGLATSVGLAAHFDAMTLTIANNTGMTNAQLEQLRTNVLRLGADSPAPLGDIAKGFEKAANAGYFGAQAMSIVTAAMKAAVETGGKVPDVVDSVTGALKNFHLPASDAGTVLGMFMRAAAEGDVRLPDLTNNFSRVATVAGAMHLPLSETAAAFSALTRFTHSASDSQTVFYGMLSHIITVTGPAKKEIDALSQASGVDLAGAFKAVSSGAIDLTTFMGEVRGAMQKAHLTSGEMTSALNTMFGGIRGGRGALILMNQGWQDYNKIAKDVASSTDLVNQQWARTTSDMGKQADMVKNKLEVIGIVIGQQVVPAVDWLMQEFNLLLSGEMQALPGQIEVVRAAFDHVHTTLVNDLSPAIRDVGTFLGDLGTQIGNDGPQLHALAEAIKKDWDTVAKGMSEDLKTISAALHEVLAPFDQFSASTKKGGDDARATAEVLNTILKVALDTLTLAAQAAATYLKVTFDAIAVVIKVAADAISLFVDVIVNLGHVFQDVGTLISDVFHGKWANLGADFSKLAADIWGVWTGLWDDVGRAFGDAINGILRGVSDFVQGVIKFFTTLWHDLVGGSIVPEMLDAIVAAFASLPGRVFSILTGFVSGVVGYFTGMAGRVLGAVTGMAGNVIGAIGGMITSTLGKVSGWAGQMAQMATSAAHNFVSGLSSLASGAVGAVENMIGAVASRMGGFIGQMAGWGAQAAGAFTSAVGGAISAGKSMIGSALGSVVNFSIGSPMKNYPFIDPGRDGLAVGQALTQGIATGIRNGQGGVSSALGDLNALIHRALANVNTGVAAASAMPKTPDLKQMSGFDLGAMRGIFEQLPPKFHEAGSQIVAEWQQKFQALHDSEVAALQKEQQNYLAARSAADAKYIADVKAARATSNLQLNNYLATHNIKITAENERHLASLQNLNSSYHQAVTAENNHYVNALATAHGKHAAAIVAAHNEHIAKLKAAHDRHVAALEKSLGITTKEQKAMLDQWLAHHQQTLEAHLAKLKATHDAHVAGIDAKHKAHVSALELAFQKHVAALKAELEKALQPGNIFDALQKAINNLVSTDLKALAEAIISGKGNIEQLTAATAKQEKAAEAMTAAQQQATDMVNRSLGSFSSSVNTLKTQLDGALSNAIAKDTYDLINHTGNLEADSLAIKIAKQQVDALTAAEQQATNATLSQYDATVKAATATYDQAVAAYEQAVMTNATTAQLQTLKDAAVAAGVALQTLTQIPSQIQAAVTAAMTPATTTTTTQTPTTTTTTTSTTTTGTVAPPPPPPPSPSSGYTPPPISNTGSGGSGGVTTPAPLGTPSNPVNVSVTQNAQLQAQIAALQAANALQAQQLAAAEYNNQTLKQILGLNEAGFASLDVSSDKGLAAKRTAVLQTLKNP